MTPPTIPSTAPDHFMSSCALDTGGGEALRNFESSIVKLGTAKAYAQ